jgi:hypothetical protein
MGSKAVGDVRRGSGQWWMAVRPRPCALRPRVASIGEGGVSQRLAMDRRSLACSGVRARRYGDEPTWQVAHDVARRHAQPHNSST